MANVVGYGIPGCFPLAQVRRSLVMYLGIGEDTKATIEWGWC